MPDFPPPWSSEEHAAFYVVKDRNGQALAHVYFDYQASWPTKMLTKDQARRIAASIAQLPEFLRKP